MKVLTAWEWLGWARPATDRGTPRSNLPTVGGRANVATPLPAAPMSRRGGTRRALTDDDSGRAVAGVEVTPG